MIADDEEVVMRKAKRLRAERWTPEQARAVLAEIGRRGVTVKQFASERGLGVERLYRWKRRLGRQLSASPAGVNFSEVTIRPSSSGSAIEIELPGGIALRVCGDSRLEDTIAIVSRLR
jgi:transposase-like protein